ncbi:hypothetical protein BCV69DRAFT_307308 [Microstroma glucosiphilum]|uniref:Protein phosphatase n=1 Tax=Pseudomicrostroma glucosiphilum TaxID=1684307 RepID=A0A316UCE4_9BASI|nr:hypothetical protein BCV69DRAFT_307308 [Pseudomicrostroma glucosiphilum]PWN22073.1 hypothetical protein BCV69DRAFT_307308 [Pseudomicrostroma glucosiphilum]
MARRASHLHHSNQLLQTFTSRGLHTTPCASRFRFLISHSFQGKPPEPDAPQPSSSKAVPPRPKKQIGWPNTSEIGKWREALLGGGEAGEDSLMVATIDGAAAEQAGDIAIGVADGVGSWSENGVDPALFSQSLMYHASQAFAAASGAADPSANPVRLISDAYDHVLADPGVPAGSSTAVVVTLESATGLLRSANVGDSGFVVLREGVRGSEPLAGALYRSSPQQYYFNAPYQLSKIPAKVMEQWKRENGGQSPSLECRPDMANRWECNLKHGDLVIVASDGAWDNVWGKEWVALVRFLREKHHEAFESQRQQNESAAASVSPDLRWKEEKTLVEVVAYNALQYTLMCQFSEKKRSPFEAEAEKSRLRYSGGKVDDIAIVVAMVVEET